MTTKSLKFDEEDILLRIYISERDKLNGIPLYEAIVMHARESQLAGATVFRGIMGYGADKSIHMTKVLVLSDNMPVVIELIDNEQKVREFIPYLDEHVKDGFVTMEKVHVIKYRIDR